MSDVLEKIRNAFKELEKRVFVSEADFQHAFAMCLEQEFPGRVRLEYPVAIKEGRVHIDVVIKDEKENIFIPIELKYLTAKIDSEEKDEYTGLKYSEILTDQMAQNINSEHVFRDIWRIEQMEQGGVCICISNDKSYWCGEKHRTNSTCHAFRLYKIENRKVLWSKSKCTFDCPETTDLPQWETFLSVGEDIKNGEFKYLYVEIPPKAKH